jgi:hypothetical protein
MAAGDIGVWVPETHLYHVTAAITVAADTGTWAAAWLRVVVVGDGSTVAIAEDMRGAGAAVPVSGADVIHLECATDIFLEDGHWLQMQVQGFGTNLRLMRPSGSPFVDGLSIHQIACPNPDHLPLPPPLPPPPRG